MADKENNYDKDSKEHHARRTRPPQEIYRPSYSGRGRGRQDPHVAKALYNFGVTDLREFLNKKHAQDEQERSKFLRRKSKSNERKPNSCKSHTRSKSIERQTISEKTSFIQNPSNIRIELSITTGERNCIIDGDTILQDIMHVPDHEFQIQTRERDIINKNQGEGTRNNFQVVNERDEKSGEYHGGSEQSEKSYIPWKRRNEQWGRGGVEQERSSEFVRGREQWKRSEQRGRGGQRRGRGTKGREWGRDSEQWRKDSEQYERNNEPLESNDYPNIQSGVMRGQRSYYSRQGGEMRPNRGEPRGKRATFRGGRRGHAHRMGQDKISKTDGHVDNETNPDVQSQENWNDECVEIPVQNVHSGEGEQMVDNTSENKHSEEEYAVEDDDENVENLVTKINENLIITSNI